MEWWQVAGLDRTLGVDRTLTLRAQSFDDACNRAADHEIVVYSDQVRPLTQDGQGERLALEGLFNFARKRRVVRLTYVKLGEITHTIRRVEVYHLLQASTGLLVHCAQVEPPTEDQPWRNFRIDRILAVEDGGLEFSARIPVSLDHGEILDYWQVNDGQPAMAGHATTNARRASTPTSSVEAYVRTFLECLSDAKLEASEKKLLAEQARGLKKSQVKVAHARILAHLLEDLVADDNLSGADNQLLKRVMKVMDDLGWAPTL